MEPIVVEAQYCADWNRGINYRLRFPLSELANCIAIVGWTITNDMPIEGPVRDEIRRLRTLPYLTIPEDVRGWYAKYATRYQTKPFGGILEELGAVVIGEV